MLLIIAAIAIGVLIIIFMYNSLVRSKNDVENAFAGMDVQLKMRYDLIPNLVATVKQYASHEKDILENVTALRAKAMSGNISNDEKVALDNQISKGIGGIMVAVENYPDLKANENFVNLQRSLNEIESQISASRRAYNSAVTDYNNAVETFPKNIMAGMMGYKRKEVFVIPEVERQNVNVADLFK
jgi:LemA protein